MKVATKHIHAEHATNPLEEAARRWLNYKGRGYDYGAAGAYRDLTYGGCSSGIVSDLIYTSDCERFAKRHIADILAQWQSDTDDLGERPMPAKGKELNLGWLARYGFERAAQSVASRAGIE